MIFPPAGAILLAASTGMAIFSGISFLASLVFNRMASTRKGVLTNMQIVDQAELNGFKNGQTVKPELTSKKDKKYEQEQQQEETPNAAATKSKHDALAEHRKFTPIVPRRQLHPHSSVVAEQQQTEEYRPKPQG